MIGVGAIKIRTGRLSMRDGYEVHGLHSRVGLGSAVDLLSSCNVIEYFGEEQLLSSFEAVTCSSAGIQTPVSSVQHS